MNFIKLLTFLCLSSFFSFFFTKLNSISYKVGEAIEINDLEEQGFYDVSDIEIINNEIFVSDLKGLKIYKFDRSGNYINKTGRLGRGPGEYTQGPRFISYSNEQVFVVGFNPWLNVYDMDLNFIENRKFIKSPANIHGIESVPETGELIIAPTKFYEEDLIVYDVKTSEITNHYLNFPIEPGLLSKYKFIKLTNKWIAAWFLQNRFIIYDSDFNKIKEFSLPEIPEKAKGEVRKIKMLPKELNSYQAKAYGVGTFLPYGTFFNSFTKLDENHFIIQLGSLTGGNNNSLIVNNEGEIVQKLQFPQKGLVLMKSHQGVLYFFNRSTNRIEAYKLIKENG